MKRIIPAALAFLFFTSPVFAQDTIGYIPGMPVPQAAPAAASDASEAGTPEAGKLARVSKAGEMAKAQETPAPQPVALDQGTKGYKGVTPPSRLVPENISTFTKTSGNQLSWIGFMPDDGAHRIFLQTSQPTSFERIASAQDRVEIRLLNTKLAVANNNRELDMSYFQTPFLKAKATKDGSGVKVVVQLKEAVPCEVTQKDSIISIVASK